MKQKKHILLNAFQKLQPYQGLTDALLTLFTKHAAIENYCEDQLVPFNEDKVDMLLVIKGSVLVSVTDTIAVAKRRITIDD
jgi:hypothetical protein